MTGSCAIRPYWRVIEADLSSLIFEPGGEMVFVDQAGARTPLTGLPGSITATKILLPVGRYRVSFELLEE